MQSRKEKEREFKEQMIIEAAAKLFAENKIENVKMDDIAKAADYTKPTLYNYFKSKDDILIGVYLKGWYESVEKIYFAFSLKGRGIDKLGYMADAYFNYFSSNAIYFDLLRFIHSHNIKVFKSDSEAKKRYETNRLELRDKLSDIFTLGKSDGSIYPKTDCKIAVEYFLSNLYMVMYRIYSEEKLEKDFIEKSKEMILRTFSKL